MPSAPASASHCPRPLVPDEFPLVKDEVSEVLDEIDECVSHCTIAG